MDTSFRGQPAVQGNCRHGQAQGLYIGQTLCLRMHTGAFHAQNCPLSYSLHRLGADHSSRRCSRHHRVCASVPCLGLANLPYRVTFIFSASRLRSENGHGLLRYWILLNCIKIQLTAKPHQNDTSARNSRSDPLLGYRGRWLCARRISHACS